MTDREKLTNIVCDVMRHNHFAHCNYPPCSPVKAIVDALIANGVTVQQWISVEDKPPELPDKDFCSVYVNALYLDTKEVVPRLFSRSIVRGKRVERWHYPRGDRLAKAPDFWMPLPGAEGGI